MCPCKPFAVPLIALLLWLALPAPVVSAQEGGGRQAAAVRANEPPLLSADELSTTFFRPEHCNPVELLNLAKQLHGRSIFIVERGGTSSPPVQNLQMLGDSLLIYDVPSETQRILDWCKLLDVPRKGRADAALREELTVASWRPGFVGLDAGFRALQPFSRPIQARLPSGPSPSNSNIARIEDPAMLILRDTPDQIAAMLAVLDDMDKPAPQLLVSVMVLRGSDKSSAGVPAELVEDLSKLVPYQQFELVDMGMLRAASNGRKIEVQMSAGNSLLLTPEAYDAESRTLTAECQFLSADGFSMRTRTSLDSDEYTVLGASGAVPLFAVLRIVRLD